MRMPSADFSHMSFSATRLAAVSSEHCLSNVEASPRTGFTSLKAAGFIVVSRKVEARVQLLLVVYLSKELLLKI
jgi:hypothetical protein